MEGVHEIFLNKEEINYSNITLKLVFFSVYEMQKVCDLLNQKKRVVFYDKYFFLQKTVIYNLLKTAVLVSNSSLKL